MRLKFYFLIFLIIFFFHANHIFGQTTDFHFKLWGITNGSYNGSPDGYGSIFRIDSDGSNAIKVHAFAGNAGGSTLNGGVIDGMDGYFYGTARYGGANDFGLIFKIKPDGTGFTNLHDFDNTGGSDPMPGLVQAIDGTLFGMTSSGGASGGGTIFKINPDGTSFQKLMEFNATSGGSPRASFLLASNGILYGTAYQFGANDKGTLFRINQNGTGFLKLWDFNGSDGANPNGTLIEADGYLYGTGAGGGVNNQGVLFKIKLDGTGFQKLFDFGDSNGASPLSTLLMASDGYLYGSTFGGGGAVVVGQGIFNYGTVFRVSTSGSSFSIIHDFGGTDDGSFPDGALIEIPDGTLLGLTVSGGTNNLGTIFKISNGTYSKIYDFDPSIGDDPRYMLRLVDRFHQVISFPAITSKTVGDPQFNLPASSSVGLEITYISSNPEVATVSGNTLTIVGDGSTIITASQSGNVNYLAAADAMQTLFVKKDQTITFDALAPVVFGIVPFTISANASSDLPVLFASSNPSVATIDGNKVTVTGVGSATVTASQSGNSTYNAAPDVTQTLIVQAAPVTEISPADIESSLIVYPNPATDEVFIHFRSLETSKMTVRIYNLLGQCTDIKSCNLCERLQFNVATYPSGGYIVKAEHENQIYYRHFVKK